MTGPLRMKPRETSLLGLFCLHTRSLLTLMLTSFDAAWLSLSLWLSPSLSLSLTHTHIQTKHTHTPTYTHNSPSLPPSSGRPSKFRRLSHGPVVSVDQRKLFARTPVDEYVHSPILMCWEKHAALFPYLSQLARRYR